MWQVSSVIVSLSMKEKRPAVIISQSGRADSLAALRDAKNHGVRTLGIVNVVGSSIAREADNVMYTWTGRKFPLPLPK